ncbi:MAG: heavy-metal-associated domain-containing protein [Burkholderiaceae bacterium]|jgi:copper chaperone
MEFTLPTMTCGHCVRTVTEAIQQLDPNAKVTVDLPTHRVQVVTVESQATVGAVLAEAGYEPAT